MSSSSDNYKVGYGCPPKNRQFKKGRSGNPSGRPRVQKMQPHRIFQDVLLKPVVANINGKQQKITIVEAMVMALAKKAMGGDQKSIDFLLRMAEAESQKPRTIEELMGGRKIFEISEEDAKRFEEILGSRSSPAEEGRTAEAKEDELETLEHGFLR